MGEARITAGSPKSSADRIHRIPPPARWDKPFGDPDSLGVEKLALISANKPFSLLDEGQFRSGLAMQDILKFDGRITHHKPGDVITHIGDYGTSCFLLLTGQCRILLSPIDRAAIENKKRKITGVLDAIRQHLKNNACPESRDTAGYGKQNSVNTRESHGRVIHVLRNIEEIVGQNNTKVMGPGAFFGEISALTRAPRSAMIFAATEIELYELRWQGLRDLRKFSTKFRSWVDKLLSGRSMLPLLAENPVLKLLPENQLAEIARQSSFEQFGDTYWYRALGKLEELPDESGDEIHIIKKDAYLDGVLLIRGGFARVLETYGGGERTVAYLTQNQMFGLDGVIAHVNDPDRPLISPFSLKAIGYVDLIRIPTHLVVSHIVPALVTGGWIKDEQRLREIAPTFNDRGELDQSLMEDLLDKRVVNGTATMLIDLNRCVGCDECVRACAVAHDNNPRFIRHGLQHGNLQFANACMHCRDNVCIVDCPTGAIVRNSGEQVITIDDSACIGCGSCAQSCPYDNIRMVEIRDRRGRTIINEQTGQAVRKASKCDLCINQLGGPACQRACPHDALVRIDTADREALVRWLNR